MSFSVAEGQVNVSERACEKSGRLQVHGGTRPLHTSIYCLRSRLPMLFLSVRYRLEMEMEDRARSSA